MVQGILLVACCVPLYLLALVLIKLVFKVFPQ